MVLPLLGAWMNSPLPMYRPTCEYLFAPPVLKKTRSPALRLPSGSSRQADAEGVFIDELNHAAAIKTGGSSAAAPFVRRTDKAHAVQHQLLRTLGMIDIADADGLDFSGKSVGVGRRTVFAR